MRAGPGPLAAGLAATPIHGPSERAEKFSGTSEPVRETAPLTVPIADFLGDELEADAPDEWLVDRLLPVEAVAFLAGEPKTAKTWIAILLGLSVALGRSFLGRFACKQGAVVVVTEEDSVKQIRRRLWWLARGLDADPRGLPMRISALKGFRIDDPDQFARLESEAKGAALIVLDALTRVHGADENDRTEMQAVTLALQQLAARTGATVLVIHHMRKASSLGRDSARAGQRMRGTGDLHALARAILAAEKRKDDRAIELHAESNYGEDVEPFAVQLRIEPSPGVGLAPGQKRRAVFDYLGNAAEVTEHAHDAKVLELLRQKERPQSKAELRTLVGGNAKAVDDAIARLAGAKQLELVEAEKTDASGRTRHFKGWQVRS